MFMELDELIEKVLRGELELHELEEISGNANVAALVRRKFLEKKLGVELPAIASTILDFPELVGRNIENPIGAVQIPLGVAGPLPVRGDYARGEYYIPLATTEGALVASVNRGCKAIRLSGGARAKILFDGMSRAPVFWTRSVADAHRLVEWVMENYEAVKAAAEATTRHGRLVSITPFHTGNLVWLRFTYTAGDAMGMNMVTIATDAACRYIEDNAPIETRCLALSGNMCVDKKPAALNTLCGRGKTVVAEAVIKREVVENVLKTSVDDIVYINIVKNYLGSSRAVSLSYNAHYANIVAAIFIATGQDPAQVVESSMGYTWAEKRGEDLYISVTLPSLEVGTVGGGTRLPTQREALRILGVEGPGDPPGTHARKLAEIIAAAVLAGELSLLAALASGHLARAHKRLGRGGK